MTQNHQPALGTPASIRHRPSRLPLSREARSELKLLSKPCAWRAWMAIAGDWSQIALAGGIVHWAVWISATPGALILIPLAWVVIGTRMRALATILHDGSHRTLAGSKSLNFVMATIFSGWWILQVHGRYRESHVSRHHPWLGHPENDPDHAQYQRLGLLEQDPRTLLRANLLQTLLGLKILTNLPYLLRDRLLPEPGKALSRNAMLELAGFVVAWSGVLFAVGLTGNLTAFALIWGIPFVTTFQAANSLIETLEHFPLAWTQADPLEWTRNRKGGWFERWLTGTHGENWHRVHHLLPGVPFWNLGRAHEILMKAPSYAAFEQRSGGIFCRGRNGEPAIIHAMVAELATYHASRSNTMGEGR